MEQIHQSSNPLKDALAKLGKANAERMQRLRIARPFVNIGCPFVGFEGNRGTNEYFQLRVDYDPEKKGHVNLIINRHETHAFVGESESWYEQVVRNINGHYCDVVRNRDNKWQTEGQEENPVYIEGMKKYMRQYM